jgi:O-antigen/teichoic acid export membrane protein
MARLADLNHITNSAPMQPNVPPSADAASLSRTVKAQTVLSLLYRVGSTALSYILVPISLSYLDAAQYGVWLTILSVMSWLVFMDIGLGNGLRNKLAEALSHGEADLGKTMVSTGYAAIALISAALMLLMLVSAPWIQWSSVFNTTMLSDSEFKTIVRLVGSLFLFNFVLSLGQSVFYACQCASLVALSQFLLNLFAVLSIYGLTLITAGHLRYLSGCYAGSMVLANILVSVYFFKRHKELAPSLSRANLSRIKPLFAIGFKFFIIQAAALVIFATDNIIITHVLGPEQVATYNVVGGLFSGVIFLQGVILSPLWSAYTRAFTEGNFVWIRRILRILNLAMIPIAILATALVILAEPIIRWWVGPQISPPPLLIVLMGVYTLVVTWNNIYASFINGVGAVMPQLISAVMAGVLNIPLSIYFARDLDLGLSGVILGTIASLSIFAFIGPIQTLLILNRKDTPA